MRGRARRQTVRRWRRITALPLLLWAALQAAPVAAEIASAQYLEPTTRYAHGVFGDTEEWGSLRMRLSDGRTLRVTLPDDHVFEDIAPRLIDVDGDGDAEVVVIETDMALGASLAIYDETGKISETPHIGRTHRWLAPVGGADLDGDGFVELAYIDRPHLAKTLRVWRFRDGGLLEVASLPGLTNHRLGDAEIQGGIRDCGKGPEIVTADADWRRVMVTRLTAAGHLQSRDAGDYESPASFDHLLFACRY